MDFSFIKFCQWFRSVAKLFRFVELCIFLAFLWWFSSQLPFAVRISGEYCRRIFLLLFRPVCIFLLGNAIVITLLAKSGLFTGAAEVSIDNAVAEFYDELRSDAADDIDPPPAEEVVFHDKEIICEEKKSLNDDEVVVVPAEEVAEKVASYRRSKSEKVREDVKEEKLRRSETDVCRRSVAGEETTAVEMTAEDGEEFRRMIEAFIAKQMRFHRDERLAVVLHGQA